MYDQYNPTGFRLLPPVVKNLLIINGLFFLATISVENAFRINLVDIFGLHFFKSELFRPYQFVTYMFIHADFQHILYNMFALWMFGYLIENAWGPKKFLTYYMITGMGAACIQNFVIWLDISSIQTAATTYGSNPSLNGFIAFVRHYYPQYYEIEGTVRTFIGEWSLSPKNPVFQQQSLDYVNQLINMQMNVPTIGASGAVYGILLAFGMLFPNMLVYIFFLLPIKAKWVVIFYGAIEVFSGISNNPSDNVAHFAHLGGMIFGFLLIIYWRKKSHY